MKQIQLDDASLSDLFKQMALLLHSGILISDSLRIIAEKDNDTEFNKFITALADDIDSGCPVSEAFENTKVFNSHIIGFLKTSEQCGRLEETLDALSAYYENKNRRKNQLIQSLTYPCILLVLMVAIIVVLLTQVLPIFNDVYESLGGSVSGLAKGLISLGLFLNSILPYIGIAVGILLIIAALIFMIPALKDKVKTFFINIFGDSGIYRKMNNASFMQALSVAISSGLTFEEGLSLSTEIFNNKPKAKERFEKTVEYINDNVDFDEALKKCGILSSSHAYLLKLSINTGALDKTTEYIAELMSEDAENSINENLSRIEPTLVILTSLITGSILLSVMLPLIDIMKTIG